MTTIWNDNYRIDYMVKNEQPKCGEREFWFSCTNCCIHPFLNFPSHKRGYENFYDFYVFFSFKQNIFQCLIYMIKGWGLGDYSLFVIWSSTCKYCHWWVTSTSSQLMQVWIEIPIETTVNEWQYTHIYILQVDDQKLKGLEQGWPWFQNL